MGFLVTSIMACFITDPLLLLGMGALSGAGNAFLFVPTMPFIVDLTEREERHGVAALALSLNSLSMTVGSLLGGWMPRGLGAVFGMQTPSAEAFRYTLVARLMLAGLALIPLSAMTSERKRSRPGDREERLTNADGQVLESRTIKRHMAVFVAVGGLMSFGAGALFPFYNVFLRTQGATAGRTGLIFSAAGLMAAGVRLASPYVSRRLGALTAVVIVRLMPVPFYLLLMIAPSLPVAIVAHMLRTTSINMAWPIDSIYISEILPGRAGASVFSFRSAAWNLGWSISAYIAGSPIVDFGYNVAFGSYIVFMSAAMGLYYAYFIRAGRSRAEAGHEPTLAAVASK